MFIFGASAKWLTCGLVQGNINLRKTKNSKQKEKKNRRKEKKIAYAKHIAVDWTVTKSSIFFSLSVTTLIVPPGDRFQLVYYVLNVRSTGPLVFDSNSNATHTHRWHTQMFLFSNHLIYPPQKDRSTIVTTIGNDLNRIDCFLSNLTNAITDFKSVPVYEKNLNPDHLQLLITAPIFLFYVSTQPLKAIVFLVARKFHAREYKLNGIQCTNDHWNKKKKKEKWCVVKSHTLSDKILISDSFFQWIRFILAVKRFESVSLDVYVWHESGWKENMPHVSKKLNWSLVYESLQLWNTAALSYLILVSTFSTENQYCVDIMIRAIWSLIIITF